MNDLQQPDFDEILQRAQGSIPLCVAVGCIDAQLGVLLGVKTEATFAGEALDIVTAAIGELFRSANAQVVASAFKRLNHTELTEGARFREVFALSGSHLYVYQSLPQSADLVLATVCSAGANLDLVLARARAVLTELQGLGDALASGSSFAS